MKYETCPRCESTDVSDCWQDHRKLRQHCNDCNWRGEVRTPEKKEIKSVRTVMAGYFGGWEFTVYDKYGHTLMLSRSYSTEEAARADMVKECARETSTDAMPVTAVLWPATVLVHGQVYTPPIEVENLCA